MIEKDDWRLRGQEAYLARRTLYLRKWVTIKKEWDHEHCEFCWDKISEFPDTLHEAYTTEDNGYWICPECFHDFKEQFQWTLADE